MPTQQKLCETANLPPPQEKVVDEGPNYNGYYYVTSANDSLRSEIINSLVDNLNKVGVSKFKNKLANDFCDGIQSDCRSTEGKIVFTKEILKRMEYYYLSNSIGNEKDIPNKMVIQQMRIFYTVLKMNPMSKDEIFAVAICVKAYSDSLRKSNIPVLKGFITDNPPPMPKELCEPFNITKINNDTSITEIVSMIYPLMDFLVFPKTSASLRTTRCWKSIATKYLNYISIIMLMFKYQGHNEYPEELIVSHLPKWWYVVRFANHFELPGSHAMDKKKFWGEEALMSNQKEVTVVESLNVEALDHMGTSDVSLKEKINSSYRLILYNFITAGITRKKRFAAGHIDCLPDFRHKRPPIFNDINDFIAKYQKRYVVGVFDESWWDFEKHKCTTENRTTELTTTAANGVHRFEIQILETVLQASPLDTSYVIRQFANCISKSIP